MICDVPGWDKILSKLSTINAQKHINSCLDKHNKKLVAAKTEESKRKKAKKYLMGYFNKKQKTCDKNIKSTSTCNDALKKIASETMTIWASIEFRVRYTIQHPTSRTNLTTLTQYTSYFTIASAWDRTKRHNHRRKMCCGYTPELKGDIFNNFPFQLLCELTIIVVFENHSLHSSICMEKIMHYLTPITQQKIWIRVALTCGIQPVSAHH